MSDLSETLTGIIKEEQKNNPVRKGRDSRYLFGPFTDFMFLGGGSLVILVLLTAFVPTQGYEATIVLIGFYLANVVNHPHFAHSYQIFYSDYRAKISSEAYPDHMRKRYFFAGVIVPILIVAFFLYSFATGDMKLVGYSVNAMVFFVGWHYVKQGYGMAIVDSVLKKAFYTEKEKKVLLVCSYIPWICTWAIINSIFHEKKYFGVESFAVDIPVALRVPLLAAMITCAFVTLVLFIRKALRDKARTPYNGMLAYFVSVYLWLLIARINIFAYVFVPAFHSLQYMIVVWRYQLNKAGDIVKSENPDKEVRELARFFAIAVALGFAAFYGLPHLLDEYVPRPEAMKGALIFLVMFWVTINIHHYFIDNVIWRKENPDVRKYLFGAPK